MGKPSRRFSQGSSLVSSYIRDLVSKDKRQDESRGLPYLESLSQCSLSVPLHHAGLDAPNEHLEQDPFLTDRRMRSSLEEARLINWCPAVKRLVPLSVSNDGNTLCHSASLALWGVHDKNLDLRQLIVQALKSESQHEFRKRWQKEVSASRTKLQGLNYEHDVEAEWQVLVELASISNKSLRSSTPMYEPLEEFHIFVLANILRRPILVFADRPIRSVEHEEMTSSFSAMYLPLLWPSRECCRSPLTLGYCDNYFAPLISFGSVLEQGSANDFLPEVVPLVGIDQIPIENRYLTPEEQQRIDQLLKEYLLFAEFDFSKTGNVRQAMPVAKRILNPLKETQQLMSEFLLSHENSQAKPEEEPAKAAPKQTRRISRFKCGNKACSNFIDKDHFFPYCSECYPKFSSTIPKAQGPVRRKMNSANTVVAPTSLEVECAVVSCPYYAAVSCFPYCQRCHMIQNVNPKGREIPKREDTNEQSQSTSLEDRWQKLAMGIVDEQVVSGRMGVTNNDRAGPTDEVIFANLHRNIPLEDGEKCAMGGVTSTRSLPADSSRERKLSATGARSAPQRRVSREELELAVNAVNYDDWKRKVSWINEPCIRTGCTYFASTRTYPYCNQCAQDIQNAPGIPAQRNRKVSGTCTLTTLLQED